MDPELERLLAQLIRQRVADLYLFPAQDGCRVLINNNSQREQLRVIPSSVANRWVRHLKYRANMSITERRRPQAGALQLKVGQTIVDIRLSAVGDYQGRESLVVRFIYRLNAHEYSLLVPSQWNTLLNMVRRRGLLLFAGPTGSGKTTTMYRLAKELGSKAVMTIEDPVEIDEPAFLQLQVNELAGMGYQELLRVGLRHRPEVFIIGEIRDCHTASMAIQAALSGHLVMATIHARSAKGVIARLKQLGMEDYLISQAVNGVAYQRLLPAVSGEIAVLFELLSHEQSVMMINEQSGGEVSEQWQKDLAQLSAEGKISQQTKAEYEFG